MWNSTDRCYHWFYQISRGLFFFGISIANAMKISQPYVKPLIYSHAGHHWWRICNYYILSHTRGTPWSTHIDRSTTPRLPGDMRSRVVVAKAIFSVPLISIFFLLWNNGYLLNITIIFDSSAMLTPVKYKRDSNNLKVILEWNIFWTEELMQWPWVTSVLIYSHPRLAGGYQQQTTCCWDV